MVWATVLLNRDLANGEYSFSERVRQTDRAGQTKREGDRDRQTNFWDREAADQREAGP